MCRDGEGPLLCSSQTFLAGRYTRRRDWRPLPSTAAAQGARRGDRYCKADRGEELTVHCRARGGIRAFPAPRLRVGSSSSRRQGSACGRGRGTSLCCGRSYCIVCEIGCWWLPAVSPAYQSSSASSHSDLPVPCGSYVSHAHAAVGLRSLLS